GINERRYPASLTKIMTALLVIENTPDIDKEMITVSDYAVKSLMGTDSSVGGLKIGETMTARQMLYYLLMISANDGAVAIAEHYGQTVDKFVEMMNQKAAALGMNDTHYVNPHGLHDSNHYTTVHDMWILTKEALKHDVFKEITSTARYEMPATNMSESKLFVTTNMLQDPATAYYYKYASGIKTGYTDEAGRNLVSTAKQDGYSYIVILMKSPVEDKGMRVRYEFTDSRNLYMWAFSEFDYKQIYDKTSIIGEAPVTLSLDSDHVPLVPKEDLSAILPQKADLSTIKVDIHLKQESFKATVKQGDVLGTADISYAGEKIKTITLVAGCEVKSSFILVIWDFIVNIVTSKIFLIIFLIVLLIAVGFILYVIAINRKRRKRRRRRRY
ncbi:MAG: D-alanyl-D-alanine carboxypeptidase, partial [Oscillospiraceae bacterium]|nr:D-alanyl-D-alanine carboxypeptidase [Candidatus Equicaccousia limihippi]